MCKINWGILKWALIVFAVAVVVADRAIESAWDVDCVDSDNVHSIKISYGNGMN